MKRSRPNEFYEVERLNKAGRWVKCSWPLVVNCAIHYRAAIGDAKELSAQGFEARVVLCRPVKVVKTFKPKG